MDADNESADDAFAVVRQVLGGFGGEDLADLGGELLGAHEAVPVDVLFQHVVFETSEFSGVEAEAGVFEDVLDDVMCEQTRDELRAAVAFGEQLPPSILASIGDVCAVGDEFGVSDLEICQRPATFLLRRQFEREVCRAEASNFVSEGHEGV